MSSNCTIQDINIAGFDGVINGDNITVTVPAGTDVTRLLLNIVLPNGATVDKIGELDFSGQVAITVTAANGTQRVYYITVIVNNSSATTSTQATTEASTTSATTEASTTVTTDKVVATTAVVTNTNVVPSTAAVVANTTVAVNGDNSADTSDKMPLVALFILMIAAFGGSIYLANRKSKQSNKSRIV